MLSYSLKVTPAKHFVNWQQDPHGNWLARFVFPRRPRVQIEVDLVAEMTVINPFDFFVEPYAENYPFAYPSRPDAELAPYSGPCRWACARGLSRRVPREAEQTVDFLVELNQTAAARSGTSSAWSPACRRPRKRWSGPGSCRDSAWLLVQIAASSRPRGAFRVGLPDSAHGRHRVARRPAGTERDFTDLHAWAEVYLPGAGWIGLDRPRAY